MTRALLLLAGLALALAGCGKQGDLERPAPLCCARAKAEYQAQQKAAAEAQRAPPDNQPEPLPDADNEPNAAPP
ncbi:MAG: hypothetical protein JO127_18365 [Caulobacteraceae bacterium]|nr:hypothetical protein [Caulobacteraceae bacterium]